MRGLLAIWVLCWTAGALARGPTVLDEPEYVDSKADSILFFEDEKAGEIVIRACRPGSLNPEQTACQIRPGSADVRIEKSAFASALASLLFYDQGNYSRELRRKIAHYRKLSQAERPIAEQTLRLSNLQGLLDFSPGFGVFADDYLRAGGDVCSDLNQAELQRRFTPDEIDAKKEIDAKLDYLVSGISSAGLVFSRSHFADNTGLNFNLLKNYLELFTPFMKSGASE